MSYKECTEDMIVDARRVFQEDILSLKTLPPFMIMEDVKSLIEKMMVFRRQCFNVLSRDEYNYFWSLFNGALLKMAVVLDELDIKDEQGLMIRKMFTDTEKKVIREFEKYSKLEPDVTPPDRLAEIIVARKGEIYELVAEAVRKQYIDFAGLIKTWTTKGEVRDTISRALQIRYEKRFKNIVNAIKRLVDQQPAWLLRLFSEYEDALIDALKLREKAEATRSEVRAKVGGRLEDVVNRYLEEHNRVEEMIKEVEEKGISPEILKEIEKLKQEKEYLLTKSKELEERLNEAQARLEEAIKALREKEEELKKMSTEYEDNKAAKEALEAEAERLRRMVDELKKELDGYKDASTKILLKNVSVGSKLEDLEATVKGVEGRLIGPGEARALELMFIERFSFNMNKVPLKLYNPLEKKEILVKKWKPSDRVISYLTEDKGVPRGTSISYNVYTGILKRKKILSVEAFYFVRPEAYSKGFDSKPLGLGELMDIISERLDKARAENYYHVLLLASPTGFTDKAKEYVSGSEYHKLFLSTNLAVALFDPIDGGVYYHPLDPSIKRFEKVLTPLVSFEETKIVADKIMELEVDALARSPNFPYFTIDELMGKTGARREVVRAAMEKLAKEGKGKVQVVDKKLVFVYPSEG
ncbi:MAG: hypothetical protein J7K21_05985 [Desulfurococcales archaeon]|nr:hypothetical protein [Desulfurococcales archaeon]